jgi:predicted HTH domain antitoxin
MSVTIPDELLQTAHLNEGDVPKELAFTLFQQERLTIGQAARLARMSRLAFQQFLRARQIPIHYDVKEFREDMETLRELGRL